MIPGANVRAKSTRILLVAAIASVSLGIVAEVALRPPLVETSRERERGVPAHELHGGPSVSLPSPSSQAMDHPALALADGAGPVEGSPHHEDDDPGGLRDALAAIHAGETLDPAWAHSARIQLSSALRGRESRGTKIEKIDCRSTICRVDLVHSEVKDAFAFQNLLGNPLTRPWNGDVYLSPSNDDRAQDWPQEKVMFIGREGTTLRSE